MHTFYLVFFSGSKSAKVITDLNDIRAEQRSSVIFMVRDPNPERGMSVIEAVKDLYNFWILGSLAGYMDQYEFGAPGNYIRPHQNWRSDLRDILVEDENGALCSDDGKNQSYVYGYAAPIDYELWLRNNNDAFFGQKNRTTENLKLFYIGRGIGNRFLDHIKEAIPYLSLQNIPAGNHLEYGKILKIYEFLSKTAEQHCQNLVRKIAIFTGPNKEEKAAAAELFLINHYGVYQLKNLTKGDMYYRETQFVARPKHCIGGAEWIDVVNEFSERGLDAYSQIRANHFRTFILNQEFPQLLTGDNPIHPNLVRYDVNSSVAFTTDGTDVFNGMKILDASNTPLVMLDLKVSDVNPSCVINLRPMPGKKTEFVQLIADAFFGGDVTEASPRVKNQSNDPFFKPCAANSDGKKDVWFDFTDAERPIYQIVNCPWLGHGALWSNVSLKDVLQAIINKFLQV